jgi:hypothetical protein
MLHVHALFGDIHRRLLRPSDPLTLDALSRPPIPLRAVARLLLRSEHLAHALLVRLRSGDAMAPVHQ